MTSSTASLVRPTLAVPLLPRLRTEKSRNMRQPGIIGSICGRLVKVTTGNFTTRYTSFDGLGRVTASEQQFGAGVPYAFGYTYNKTGGLATERYPSGRVVTTCYDNTGRPKTSAKA